MEADSLNAMVPAQTSNPAAREFNIFIKEVRKEITHQVRPKCTAVRRIMVPEDVMEDVQIALGKALSQTAIGDPRAEGVRMGAIAGKAQLSDVKAQVAKVREQGPARLWQFKAWISLG